MPLLLEPPATAIGWLGIAVCQLFGVCMLLGLYDCVRFHWCWRVVGALVFLCYVWYFFMMAAEGEWFGDGRRASTTAFNALCGLLAFGLPGLWYAVLGRLSWSEPDYDDVEHLEADEVF